MSPVRVRRASGNDAANGRLQIEISARRTPLMIVVLTVWLGGWTLLLLSMAAQAWRFGPAAAPIATTGLIILFMGGIAVLYALIWAALGYRETLFIGNGELRIQRGLGRWARSHVFPPFTIRNVELAPSAPPVLRDLTAIRQFWIGGAGRLHFVSTGQTFAVGVKLADVEALEILNDIKSRVPLAPPDFVGPLHRDPFVASHRWIVGLVNLFMLIPVAMVPFRALVTDRISCFGVRHEEPRFPVQVGALNASGLVYLVPIDDFSIEIAQSIARHFQERFGTRIEVQPPLPAPPAVFDNSAAQMNAHAMAALLAERYPASGERRVAIALTQSDMYIPGSGWGYAFSYRSEDRFAVVSSARMDHGCMGIVRADERRQLARLRKMVGKNIGILHYRLPLSSDPRSLRYANVGGPQELDVMAETF